MPDSKALGVTWDVENDKLRLCPKKSLVEVSTRREMLSALAGQFDPLGMLAPCLLGGKLILQKLTIMSIDWEDKISEVLYKEWCKWVEFMRDYSEFSIPRYCFANEHGYIGYATNDKIVYELHGFCDASDSALSCVIYLKQIVNGHVCVSFIQGKAK